MPSDVLNHTSLKAAINSLRGADPSVLEQLRDAILQEFARQVNEQDAKLASLRSASGLKKRGGARKKLAPEPRVIEATTSAFKHQ